MSRMLIITIIIATFCPGIASAVNCTSRVVGNITYYDCDDGSGGTSYTVGGQTYYNQTRASNRPTYQPFTPNEINDMVNGPTRALQRAEDERFQRQQNALRLQQQQLEIQRLRNGQ